MTTDPLRNAVFIVTGTNLTAEQKDRPLAYFLKQQVDRYGGTDPTRCGVVISDLWYMSATELHKYPVISVGGPGVNSLSHELWNELPVALAIDNVLLLQMDITLHDLRASVWGMDHDMTREAVQTFIQKSYLRHFLEGAWGETLEPDEQENSNLA